ncbi:MAG: cytochrome P450, partial [Terriglobus roseus]|nr:cytochrome P450 [Terriglobus roseus]
MKELYQRKFTALSDYEEGSTNSDAVDPSLDLMGAMISSSGLLSSNGKSGAAATGLSESEIIGNSFIFMLAGHETAANTITHALYFLAMNPPSQRRLQRELDDTFRGRDDAAAWDYDRDLTPLFGGLAGAVMNETLRLIPPVVIIPKSTYGVGDQ